MHLPRAVKRFGYAGLVPFFGEPLWLTLSPDTAPAWLDLMWLHYITMLAVFLAGTFWGYALLAMRGAPARFGMFMATGLMMLAWGSMALEPSYRLATMALVYLLLLEADYWRERTLESLTGYLSYRATLTMGAVAAIGWRLALEAAA